MTMSKRSSLAASPPASAKASPRRNEQVRPTPLSSDRFDGERQPRLGAVDTEDGGGPSPRRLDRKPAGKGIEIENAGAAGQGGDKAPIVALVEEPAGLLPGEQISAEHGAVLVDRHRAIENAPCHVGLGCQSFEYPRRAVVPQHDGVGAQQLTKRVEDERLEPCHAGGIRLHDEKRPEPVDDEAGQPVGFGMDEAVKGLREQTLAQFEGAPDPAGEKAAADRPGGVAVEEARGEQGVRVEHRDAERAALGAPQGDETARCERLGRSVHDDFV